MYLLVYVDVFEFSAYLRVEAHTQTYQYRFIQSVLWTHIRTRLFASMFSRRDKQSWYFRT